MAEEVTDVGVGIPEFYSDKSILVTGFTGYLGKVLVEKLLYTCPDIHKLYVLVRAKNGESAQERVQRVVACRAFDRLRHRNPEALKNKLVAVSGDMLEAGLGLSAEDRRLLTRQVEVVIHGAASVRFDDPLPSAVRQNTLATKMMVDLALEMPRLVVFTYISTAYSNSDRMEINEQLYPAKASWSETIEMCEKLDPATLQILHLKYKDPMHNTYVFSKQLAEHLVNDYRDRLPVLIVRPSIVMPALREPFPGWADNKFGPVSLVIGFFLGIIRCSITDLKTSTNLIPQDIVVNATLAASWKTAFSYKRDEVAESCEVYNICSRQDCILDNGEFSQLHKRKEVMEDIEQDGLNFISLKLVTSVTMFRIHNLYMHVLPAFFVDAILKLIKKRPMLTAIRRKVYSAALCMRYFSTRTFRFQVDKMNQLEGIMSGRDRELFSMRFDLDELVSLYGFSFQCFKHNILKKLYENLERSRRVLFWLYVIDRSFVYLTYTSLLLFVYKIGMIPFLISQAKTFFYLQ